jgi:hypothetical protein
MMELHSDLRRQQGCWNNTAMDKCYFDLPLPANRALAGFSGPGSFFLPRGTVKPPEELVELVYPALDTCIRKQDDVAIHEGLTTEQVIKVLKFLNLNNYQKCHKILVALATLSKISSQGEHYSSMMLIERRCSLKCERKVE